MIIKSLEHEKEITAGDNTSLKEIIKPDTDNLPIGYSLAFARLKPNTESYRHSLKSSEVYILIKGKGIMHIDDETKEVKEGDTIFIPKDSVQFIENTGDSELEFYCIVEPAWKKEDETIINE